MSPIELPKTFKNFIAELKSAKDIKPCEPDTVDAVHLVVVKDDAGKKTFKKLEMSDTGDGILMNEPREVTFEDIKVYKERVLDVKESSEDYRKDWAELMTGYNAICKVEEGSGKDAVTKIYAFRKVPPFLPCSPETETGKVQMNIALSKEASKYLASKFASFFDGCSSITEEGYENKVKMDQGTIKNVKQEILNDMAANKLPPSVRWDMALRIVADLDRILTENVERAFNEQKSNQEKALEAQNENMKTQMALMKDQMKDNKENMDRMFWVQVGSSGFMGFLFGLQLWMSRGMIKQNSEIAGTNFGKGEEVLRKFGEDLIEKMKRPDAEPVDMTIRANELKQTVLAILRKKSVLLLGKAGVGKTAFAEGLAAMLGNNEIPQLKGKTLVYSIPIADLVAGTSFRGMFEARLKAIMKAAGEIVDKGKRVILFMDEFHLAMGAGATQGSGMDFANIMKPALSRRELTIIGATTLDESKRIMQDAAMARRFQLVTLIEFGVEATKKAVAAAAKRIMTAIKGVAMKVNSPTVDRVVELAGKYLPDVAAPANAIELLGQAAAGALYDDPNVTELTPDVVQRTYDENIGSVESGSKAENWKSHVTFDDLRGEQIKNLQRDLTQIPGLYGKLTPEIVERIFDRLSALSPEEGMAIGEDSIKYYKALMRMASEEIAASNGGSRKGPDGPPDEPPTGATGGGEGGGAPATATDEDGGQGDAEMSAVPLAPLPAWMTGTATLIKEDVAGRTMWDIMAEKAQVLVPKTPALAQGAGGNLYMVDVDTAVGAPTETFVRGSPVKALAEQGRLEELGVFSGTGVKAFAHTAVGGLVGGAGALTIIHSWEDGGHGKMPWYGEVGVFAGTGVGASIGMSSICSGGNLPLSQILSPGALVGGTIVSLPASFATFSSATVVGDWAGFETGTRGNEWFTVSTGSLMVAGAMTAEIPFAGASAASLGISWTALGLSAIGGIGVGVAALGGGAVGLGIDHGLGAAGLESSDGDKTFSGWAAESVFRWVHDDYETKPLKSVVEY